MGIKANLCNVQQVLAVLSVPPFPLDRALQVTSSCFGSFGKHCHGKGQNLILFHPSVMFGGWEDGMVGNTLPGVCQPASQPPAYLGCSFCFHSGNIKRRERTFLEWYHKAANRNKTKKQKWEAGKPVLSPADTNRVEGGE